MEYIYAAMILHTTGKEINEENVKNIIEAAGEEADDSRIKALIAALEDVDIDEEFAQNFSPAALVAAEPVVSEPDDEEEEDEEEQSEEEAEEEAAAGLGALFG